MTSTHQTMHTTNNHPAARVRMRRLLPAALIAASAAFGSLALGYPAIAGATNEWDIGKYDQCIANGGHPLDCCLDSGGEIETTPGDPNYNTCVAPAPEVHTPVQPRGQVFPTEQTQVPDQPQGPELPRRGQVGTLPTIANPVP